MNLFAYGALMVPEVMRRVTGRSFRGTGAVLRGYVRLKMRDALYPGLILFPDMETDGVVFFDLDDASRARIDRFEGGAYERVEVTVETEEGEWVEADTYLLRPSARKGLSGQPWDEDEFRAHLREFLDTCPPAPVE